MRSLGCYHSLRSKSMRGRGTSTASCWVAHYEALEEEIDLQENQEAVTTSDDHVSEEIFAAAVGGIDENENENDLDIEEDNMMMAMLRGSIAALEADEDLMNFDEDEESDKGTAKAKKAAETKMQALAVLDEGDSDEERDEMGEYQPSMPPELVRAFRRVSMTVPQFKGKE